MKKSTKTVARWILAIILFFIAVLIHDANTVGIDIAGNTYVMKQVSNY
jgi:hypothetical protein